MNQAVIILSPLRVPSGNYTTAKRLQSYLSSHSELCRLLATENTDRLQLEEMRNEVKWILAIHAFHAGRLLQDMDVPYALVFGGTDINVYSCQEDSKRLMDVTVARARVLVCFNKETCDRALEIWPSVKVDKLLVIPQGVRTDPSSFCFKEYLIKNFDVDPDDLVVFVLVAGIRPVKDPLYPTQAFQDWQASSRRNIYLIIIGPILDEHFGSQFQDEVKRLSRVLFLGALSERDTHAAIRDSFALVNCSVSEGMSVTILEAMDLGVAVLARNIPGNASLIEDRVTGLLFNSPQDFVKQAEFLLQDGELRQSLISHARKRVNERHSMSVEREAYSKLKAIMET